jgi:hypothetical protein
MIKALRKRNKYPPDKEAAAMKLVLQQTDVISEEWASLDVHRRDVASCRDQGEYLDRNNAAACLAKSNRSLQKNR